MTDSNSSSDSRVKKCRKKPPFLLAGNKELVVVQLDMTVLVPITSYLVPNKLRRSNSFISVGAKKCLDSLFFVGFLADFL